MRGRRRRQRVADRVAGELPPVRLRHHLRCHPARALHGARRGGGLLKQKAALELQTALNDFIRSEGQQGLAQVFSLRREFPTDWHRFLNPASVTGDQTVTLGLTKDRFPLLFQSRPITVGKIEVFIKVQPDFVATHNDATVKLTTAAGDAAPTSAI